MLWGERLGAFPCVWGGRGAGVCVGGVFQGVGSKENAGKKARVHRQRAGHRGAGDGAQVLLRMLQSAPGVWAAGTGQESSL